jgi:hypothetical protein
MKLDLFACLVGVLRWVILFGLWVAFSPIRCLTIQ